MAIGLERRNMLLQRYVKQKETTAEIVKEKLKELHEKREALRKKMNGEE